MKKYIGLVLLSMIILVCSISWAQQQEISSSSDITTLAREFVELLVKEDFPSAVKRFDTTMKTALPSEKLQEAWESITGQVGHFKRQVSTRIEKAEKYDIVFVTVEFEKFTLDVKVVFNNSKEIAGLFFVPSQPPVEHKAPVYVKPNSFQEKELMVGIGEWAVHGTLTIPIGEGPFPAVVLVHGSGPQDRDESIGPNKPFRDIAWGLASQGIAVLRYEKRTKEHAQKFASIMNTITVKEETIDDVLSAVSILRKREGINSQRIFVLGHSLGGMLIPRMGLLDPDIAGFIIMAGTTRPLEDVILDQFSYIFSLDGSISEEENTQIEKIRQQVAKVKDMKLSDAVSPAELPFSVPAQYWLDLRGYNPAETAKQLKQPMLILQGERDYQVTMEDFQGWKNSLSSRKNVQFKSYPKLNHLFIEGQGKITPDEYLIAGHVSEIVIDDIAGWIKKP